MIKSEIIGISFFRECHGEQSYPDGTPYRPHVMRVGNTIKHVLEYFAEGDKETILSIQLGGYGHDAFEDTKVGKDQIINLFGNHIFQLIWGMTNEEDDDHTTKYISKIIGGTEEVKLIKLADIYENLNSIYVKMDSTNYKLLYEKIMPIIWPMRNRLQIETFTQYKKSSGFLVEQISILNTKIIYNYHQINQMENEIVE